MKEEKQYVYLDGMLLCEEHLKKLALNVGCYAQAEHYLFALLAHGVIHGKREVMDIVNDVREHYGVPRIPMENEDISSDVGKRKDSVDDKVRALFKKMDQEMRKKILRDSLQYLQTNYHLFIYTRHWLGVFLVIRDRLEGESLKQRNFEDYANSITPEEWPDGLKICKNTFKNFGREINREDKGEAYYDMKSNPQKELCDTLWDIIKQMILTTI